MRRSVTSLSGFVGICPVRLLSGCASRDPSRAFRAGRIWKQSRSVLVSCLLHRRGGVVTLTAPSAVRSGLLLWRQITTSSRARSHPRGAALLREPTRAMAHQPAGQWRLALVSATSSCKSTIWTPPSRRYREQGYVRARLNTRPARMDPKPRGSPTPTATGLSWSNGHRGTPTGLRLLTTQGVNVSPLVCEGNCSR
jgi:hypothetical protein